MYTLALHDALPIYLEQIPRPRDQRVRAPVPAPHAGCATVTLADSRAGGSSIRRVIVIRLTGRTRRHRVLSFEWRSTSRFVNSTRPKICVHSETMLPTTWPHLASESIEAYSAIHPTPVITRKILREGSRNLSQT